MLSTPKTLIIVLLVVSGAVSAMADRLSFEARPNRIVLRQDGQPLGDYVFRDPDIPRPYFTGLRTPDGVQVTRNHPPREGEDPTDHKRLHPGLWMAFGDLNGVDFWRNAGRVEHIRFLQEPTIQKGRLVFSVESRYLSKSKQGDEVCRGIDRYELVPGDQLRPPQPGTLLVWNTTLRKEDGALTLGPQHEMGLGYRVATPLTVETGSGSILGSHGGKNEAGNWGRIGEWWDYSGPIDGRRVGILSVVAPKSDIAFWAHSRDYGFLAMNPTGPPPDAQDVPSIPRTVPAGQPLRMKFGVLLYSTPLTAPFDAVEAARAVSDELTDAKPAPSAKDQSNSTPQAVATFNCMSLYWPNAAGGVANECSLDYRQQGTDTWRPAQPLWWDADHGMYAGSVVGLDSGTPYEFRLGLESGQQTRLGLSTWPDRFPVARVVKLPSGVQNTTLTIDRGGSPQGYVVYEADPTGTTIDADPTGGDEGDALDHCVVIDADYVIVRGLTLRNAKIHSILIKNRHDVVIEGCDISNWGRKDPQAGQPGLVRTEMRRGDGLSNANREEIEVVFSPRLAMQMDSAIKGDGGESHDIERVVVQGNRIHHPRYCANAWNEPSAYFRSSHPQGAKAVVLFRPGQEAPTKGNHVIRYNEFYSDAEHMFNDILFESHGGQPPRGTDAQRDMDIYGNVFSDCWDDVMELERGFGNVRVWDNYFTRVFKSISCFTHESGPYYVFRNVFDHILQPCREYAPEIPARAPFVFQNEGGRFYFYHNTLLCPGGEQGDGYCWAYGNEWQEQQEGRGVEDDGNFTISRNNIYQTIRWPDERNYVTRRLHGGFSFDHDLYNGEMDAHLPEAAKMWGDGAIQGSPKYRTGHGSGYVGRAQLAADSPGKDQGCRLPNFNDDYEGSAPDIGAHEHGSPDMSIGVGPYYELYGSDPANPCGNNGTGGRGKVSCGQMRAARTTRVFLEAVDHDRTF